MGTADDCVRRLADFAEAGARHFLLVPIDTAFADFMPHVERYATEIIPRLRPGPDHPAGLGPPALHLAPTRYRRRGSHLCPSAQSAANTGGRRAAICAHLCSSVANIGGEARLNLCLSVFICGRLGVGDVGAYPRRPVAVSAPSSSGPVRAVAW